MELTNLMKNDLTQSMNMTINSPKIYNRHMEVSDGNLWTKHSGMTMIE